MQYKIRQATAHDMDAVAQLRADAWADAYADLVSPEALAFAREGVADVSAHWQREMLRGVTPWLGIDATGRVVGFAIADAAGPEERPALIELKLLYLAVEARGSGLASALLNAAVGVGVPACLYTFEGNERAIAFYRRHGFDLDGHRRPWPGNRDDVPDELRLVRP